MSSLEIPAFPLNRDDMPWPAHEPVFFVDEPGGRRLIGRNHPWFRSLVPLDPDPASNRRAGAGASCRWKTFRLGIESRFPKIGQRDFDDVLAFFEAVHRRYGSEAIVLLSHEASVGARILVPRQTGFVEIGSGNQCLPLRLLYRIPCDSPPRSTLYGSIHSHGPLPPCSSQIDDRDSAFQTGIHIVVGRLGFARPEILAEVVVDGYRRRLSLPDVVEGYQEPEPAYPPEWMTRLRVEYYCHPPACRVGRESQHSGLRSQTSGSPQPGNAGLAL